ARWVTVGNKAFYAPRALFCLPLYNANAREAPALRLGLLVVSREQLDNVRFWPKADIPSCTAHVRFWGQSGHVVLRCTCLLLTQSGHCCLHRTCPLSGVKRT